MQAIAAFGTSDLPRVLLSSSEQGRPPALEASALRSRHNACCATAPYQHQHLFNLGGTFKFKSNRLCTNGLKRRFEVLSGQRFARAR